LSDQPSRRPRVLLADDNAGIGVTVSRLLSVSCEFVGRVPDAATLFEAVAQLQPDVVLLDFSLPGGNPLDLSRQLRALRPEIRVVAFTAEDDPEVQRAAFEAGVSGFVWKPRAGRDLVTTIHDVYVSDA
jgi:DNA-binding NarL/FixJ family response regulator